MGVKGLWQLLLPTGRRISIETLSGKRLAIDASIWLTQFLKANRDPETGAVRANAHIIGFLRRICKLLFHGIQPVFVFDGATPEIKLREIRARKERRDRLQSFKSDDDNEGVKRLARRILVAKLKRQKELEKTQKMEQNGESVSESKYEQSKDKTGEITRNNLSAFASGFNLGRQRGDEEQSKESDSDSEEIILKPEKTPAGEEIELSDDDEQDYLKSLTHEEEQINNDWDKALEAAESVDEESVRAVETSDDETNLDIMTLTSLPAKTRVDAIEKARRNQRMQSRKEFMSVAANPQSYSQCQLKNFLKSAHLNKQVTKLGEMSVNNGQCGQEGERIASDSTRRIIFTSKTSTGDQDPLRNKFMKYGQKKSFARKDSTGKPNDTVSFLMERGINAPSEKQSYLYELENEDTHGRGFADQDSDNIIVNQTVGYTDSSFDDHDCTDQGGFIPSTNCNEGGFIAPTSSSEGGFLATNDDGEMETGHMDSDEENGAEVAESKASAKGAHNLIGERTDSILISRRYKEDDFQAEEGIITMPKNKVGHLFVNASNNEVILKDKITNDKSDESGHHNDVNRTFVAETSLRCEQFQLEDRAMNHDNFQLDSEKNDAVICHKPLDEDWNHGEPPVNEKEEEDLDDDCEWEDGDIHENSTRDVSESDLDSDADHMSVVQNRDISDTNRGVVISSKKRKLSLSYDKVDHAFEGPLDVPGNSSTKQSESANAAALMNAHATASQLTDWAGRVVRQAIKMHLGERASEGFEASNKSISCDGSLSSSSSVVLESSTIEEENQMIIHEKQTTEDSDASKCQMNHFSEFRDTSLEALQKQDELLHEENNRRERDMDTVTDEMIDDVIYLLQIFGIPYIKAPAEAEAQAVELEKLGLVDGVITEDSDAIVFGGNSVYRNIFDDKKYVEVYLSADSEAIGLGYNEKIALAMLLGGDYTQGVKGVGIVNGMEILKAFPVTEGILDGLRAFRNWLDGFDFDDKINNQNQNIAEFTKKHKSARTRWTVPSNFPSSKVLQAYTRPVVDSSKTKFSWGVPDVEAIRKFLFQKVGWEVHEIDRIVLPVMKGMQDAKRQTRIDGYFMRSEDNIKFADVRSKRLRTVWELDK